MSAALQCAAPTAGAPVGIPAGPARPLTGPPVLAPEGLLPPVEPAVSTGSLDPAGGGESWVGREVAPEERRRMAGAHCRASMEYLD
ncbi:hypothetical protein ACIRBX_35225 [Kitasatospora sp. NPDC096147]|uniref:hypothetical protein n=1 Tax=Kitasatospora sp. NPDC096147 TaxID=3364093 RepID=UPI0037F13AAD